jgi:signal transduction histidine kinase
MHPSTSYDKTIIPNALGIPLFLILIAAGLTGNFFNFPIFHGIDFLFGSIFAMLALQFFGLSRGIMAAAIIAAYTYILWNHPFAIILMTAEVAVVGWLMVRRAIGMVLADALYWLIIGMPLAYLFYHLVMHVPSNDASIIMLKQAINGIFNALVARLIFTVFALQTRSVLMPYSEIVYDLLVFFVLCPALVMMAIESRADFTSTQRRICATLSQDSQRMDQRLGTWVENRKTAILNLAELAASKSPQQMQLFLEQAKKSDINFLRVGLLDASATTIAYFPLIDELGQKNIGKNFSDRPFIPQLKQTLKPMLSEIVMSRIGTPKPVVSMLAPVVNHGIYSGYVIGVLSLEQLKEYLNKSSEHNTMLYTLLDKNGNVIMTNRIDQKVMFPFVRGVGTLNRVDNGISQWVPDARSNTPFFEKWNNSRYISELTVGPFSEWKLVLEQPVAAYKKLLYDEYTGKLTMLFLLLFVALALAEFLSRKIVVTLSQLSALTHEMPVQLATGVKEINWPESSIRETHYLAIHFKEMADSLSDQFCETRQINESLEQRVMERTEELHFQTVELEQEMAERQLAQERLLEQASQLEKLNETLEQRVKERTTELSERNAEILEAYDDLKLIQGQLLQQDKMASIGNLAAGVAHEINNPMGYIISNLASFSKYVDKLTTYLDATEQYFAESESGTCEHLAQERKKYKIDRIRQDLPELISQSREGAERVRKIVQDLKSFSRVDNSPGEFSDIIEGLESTLTIAWNELKYKATVNREYGQLPQVRCNMGQLNQVFLNILVNAAHAIEGQGSIRIATWAEAESVKIAISDSGSGIAPENVKRIFDPFFTTKEVGKGTGLGLAIAYDIVVNKHGGTIDVTSEIGTGTTFTITLPVKKND